MKKVLLEIKLNTPVIEPKDIEPILERISEKLKPEERGDSIIVTSGRLPVWLYSAITHHLHPFSVVATFEPRLLKGVVVASHHPMLRVGELVDISDAEKITIEYP